MESTMQAADIMTRDVISVASDDFILDAALLLLKHRISAVPVLDKQGRIVGIVSESDLMRRVEIATDEQGSWWHHMWAGKEELARDYIRTHGRKIADVMTARVITAAPDTSLKDLANLLERNRIKRVPIVVGETVVGIVSRADLLRAFATSGQPATAKRETATDDQIRDTLRTRLRSQGWISESKFNIAVDHGVVDLWAAVDSEAERKALRIAAESIPGVTAVRDHVVVGSLPTAI
jgi:CBS domain-containing protein